MNILIWFSVLKDNFTSHFYSCVLQIVFFMCVSFAGKFQYVFIFFMCRCCQFEIPTVFAAFIWKLDYSSNCSSKNHSAVLKILKHEMCDFNSIISITLMKTFYKSLYSYIFITTFIDRARSRKNRFMLKNIVSEILYINACMYVNVSDQK